MSLKNDLKIILRSKSDNFKNIEAKQELDILIEINVYSARKCVRCVPSSHRHFGSKMP